MENNQTRLSEASTLVVHASPVVAACHIHTLPTEVLLNVFSFLSQRDQLEVRTVCRRWSQVLSVSSLTFLNSTTFNLDPSTDGYSTLLSGGATWKRVQICGLKSTTDSQDWFRSLAIGSVRCLIFRNSVFNPNFIRTSLVEFPALEELEFINSKLEVNNEEEVEEGVISPWKDFLRLRLKSLTLEVGESGILGNLLKLFVCPPGSCLRKLFIRTTYSYACYNHIHRLWLRYHDSYYYSRERRYFKRILLNSISSLQHISLKARCRNNFQPFWSFFKWDSPRMNQLRLHTLELTPGFTTSRLPIFLTFLKSKSDLTSVSLPLFLPAEDMAALLPNHLTTIEIGCMDAFRQPQFILKLSNVKTMIMYFFTDQFQDFNAHLVGQVLPQLESLTILRDPAGPLAFTLVNSFPNLKKLIITIASETLSVNTVDDTELQLLITGLPCLTVLKLSSCTRITDFGIAGIEQKESNSILSSIRADGGLELETLQIARKGATLKDLQGLEELGIEGSSQISDVGVAFGLVGLRNLRQLDLSTENKELTDWGLIRLAKKNSMLERMHVECVPSQLAGFDSLEKTLAGELKSSSGRFKRLDVSIKVSLKLYTDVIRKKLDLRLAEKIEVADVLEILHQIKTYDNLLANKGNNNSTPAQVYLQLRDNQIDLFKSRYLNLNQFQQCLLRSTTQFEHLLG